ncbi:MAG: hypothetical protein EOR48_21410 [Mesorhizobium sp.]|nr:MAG: hypothetical protein EOR48_21410 [Mesorhizobium sp.]TIP47500.1 MAG: hypothetical protein E5X62_05315 [Mesorhizobium sp.]
MSPHPALRATFSPRGEEIAHAGASLFSPPGRRWHEGPDEGALQASPSPPLRNSAQQLRKPEHFLAHARTIIAYGQRRPADRIRPPRRSRPGADREDRR